MSDGSGAAVELGGSSAAPPSIIPEAMAADLVAAWADLTNVSKSKTANAGTYSYSYGDLGDLLDVARPILGKHGLALIQPLTRTEASTVTIWTMLVHTSGHVLMWGFDVAAGNSPQQTGSAITYGRRYGAAAALGIAFEDDDDDGKAATAPPVETFEDATLRPQPAQTNRVRVLFDELGVTDRKERNDLYSAIVGREVPAWAQLTRDEAIVVIEELERRVAGLESARDGVGRLPDV